MYPTSFKFTPKYVAGFELNWAILAIFIKWIIIED